MVTGDVCVSAFIDNQRQQPWYLCQDKMTDIFAFSRNMVATNTLEILLADIVRYTTEILQVYFSRIITIEAGGVFESQAAFSSGSLPRAFFKGQKISLPVQSIFQRAISDGKPLRLNRDDTLLSSVQQDLGLNFVENVCVFPLIVDSKSIGILVLGDGRRLYEDSLWKERQILAGLIADQAASAILRARLNNRLHDSQVETVLALAKTLEARDSYSSGHGEEMVGWSEGMARKLGCPWQEIESIHWAALLHDIGKVAIPDEVLYKPSALTKNEWDIVRKHPKPEPILFLKLQTWKM